jgi:hypothetical protein
MHLFLDCVQTFQCWKEANLWDKVEHHQRQSDSFSNIIFSPFSQAWMKSLVLILLLFYFMDHITGVK